MGESWSRQSILFPLKTHESNENAPATRAAYDVLIKYFAKNHGAYAMAPHSARKGLISACCNATIGQGIMKMLARLSLGTLDHYLSCLPDTIAYYHAKLYRWAESAYISVSNGELITYHSYF